MKALTQEEEKAALISLCRIEVKRWKVATEGVPEKGYMVKLMEIALAALAAEPYCHAMERPSNGELVVVSAPRKGTFPLYRLPPAPAP